MSTELSVKQFQKVMPAKMKKNINPEFVDQVNNTINNIQDPEMREQYRDNLLSYASVMNDGRFKITQYLSAVRYVGHKLLGDTNDVSYIKTFPDKYNDFITRGVVAKDIASYVSAYNKSKLVNLIMEQTMIPSHVLNMDLYQKALNTQAELMVTASSEKVRTDAANSLLTHLKPPETKKIELDVNLKEDKSIQELRDATMGLAAQQREMMKAGMSAAKEIAESTVITGEFEEVK